MTNKPLTNKSAGKSGEQSEERCNNLETEVEKSEHEKKYPLPEPLMQQPVLPQPVLPPQNRREVSVLWKYSNCDQCLLVYIVLV